MLNDNNSALLDYLIVENYNLKYEIGLILSKDVWCEAYINKRNVKVINGIFTSIWYTLRSKYIFNTHGMSLLSMRPARKQIIFNLWHGMPLKKMGKMLGLKQNSDAYSYFLSTSPFFEEVNMNCFDFKITQSFIGSNPRNDNLFRKIDLTKSLNISSDSRVIVFMPTFRKNASVGCDYSGSEFPLLNEENIEELNEFLANNNDILIIKPHPYQQSVPIFTKNYSNIKVLTNLKLSLLGINLYSLLGSSDALITDFSSVYFDYLLTNKPIGFLIEDMSTYSKDRGFALKNPLSFMPGSKFSDIKGLEKFILDVNNNNDPYRKERERVNNISNSYQTSDSCKRILDFVGICK